MKYTEYKQQPAGWKGVVLDDTGRPYLWIHSDGTWKAESQINRGPFGGDQEVMLQYMRKEGFLCGEARCMECGREWTAVCENAEANGELECPGCGKKKGIIFDA